MTKADVKLQLRCAFAVVPTKSRHGSAAKRAATAVLEGTCVTRAEVEGCKSKGEKPTRKNHPTKWTPQKTSQICVPSRKKRDENNWGFVVLQLQLLQLLLCLKTFGTLGRWLSSKVLAWEALIDHWQRGVKLELLRRRSTRARYFALLASSFQQIQAFAVQKMHCQQKMQSSLMLCQAQRQLGLMQHGMQAFRFVAQLHLNGLARSLHAKLTLRSSFRMLISYLAMRHTKGDMDARAIRSMRLVRASRGWLSWQQRTQDRRENRFRTTSFLAQCVEARTL
eukprot:6090148-Amphidinium_carterae.1